VHSGKTTTGLSDVLIIVSSGIAPLSGNPFVEGVVPNEERILNNETRWNPAIAVRCIVLDLLIAAEPVPVLLPGVDLFSASAVGAEATGRTKIGSKLHHVSHKDNIPGLE
jgi:hypothetical protein